MPAFQACPGLCLRYKKKDESSSKCSSGSGSHTRLNQYLASVSSKGLSRNSLSSTSTSPFAAGSGLETSSLKGSEAAWLIGAAQLKVRLSEGLPNMICMMKVKGALECLQAAWAVSKHGTQSHRCRH